MDQQTPFSIPTGFRTRGFAGSMWRQADLRTRVIVVFLAVLAIPVLILLAVAAIAIMLVMSIFVAASALLRRFTGPRSIDGGGLGGIGRGDGRENVRVVRRQ